MRAASQLPGKGPSDVDDALIKNPIIYIYIYIFTGNFFQNKGQRDEKK